MTLSTAEPSRRREGPALMYFLHAGPDTQAIYAALCGPMLPTARAGT